MKKIISIILLILLQAGKIHAQTPESANANYPQLTNIPTLYINTNNVPITSKDYYVPGTLVAVSSDPKEALLGIGWGEVIEIRGRGNSTWGMAKKPYRIKFGGKINFMNLPAKARNWTLMANYADKTLMRNAVASKISEIIGLEFSPAAKFVDVVLNGEYIGNYMVSDHKDVRKFRVDVEEQDDTMTTLPDISGGYLVEIDGFAGSRSRPWFRTNQGMPVSIRYPNNDEGPRVNPEQIAYITNFTQRFENALFSQNFKDPELGYRALVDTFSLVNWYIGCELTGNPDAFWSTYLYKRRNIDKFFFGPMWDFDIAFNNDSRLGEATEKLMREHAHNPKAWIQQLWKDEWFRGAVYRRWMQLVKDEKIIDKLTAYIDETAVLINESQKRNFQKWNILGYRVYLEQVLFYTYAEYVTYLKTYLNRRANFLTQNFTSNKPEEPSQPFVAGNFYYMILNVNSNNAIQVQNRSNEVNAKLELWAPQEDYNYQEWIILPIDEDKFQIINRHTGLAMTGNGRGNNLIQTNPDTNDAAQQWTINPVLTGNIYGIINVKSKYSINNSGGNFQNGTAIIEYDERITESRNQQWYFIKTGKIESFEEVDKLLLEMAIIEVGFYLAHTTAGNDPDRFSIEARITLEQVLENAVWAFENEDTQVLVDNVTEELKKALADYRNSVHPFLPADNTVYNIIHSSGLYLGKKADDFMQIALADNTKNQQFTFIPVDTSDGILNILHTGTRYFMEKTGDWNIFIKENIDTEANTARFVIRLIYDDLYLIEVLSPASNNRKYYLGTDSNSSGSDVYSDKDGSDERHYWRIVPADEESAIKQPNTNNLFVYVSGGVLYVDNLTGNNVISIYTL